MKSRMPIFKKDRIPKFNLDPMLVDGTLDFGVNETTQRSNKKALNR